MSQKVLKIVCDENLTKETRLKAMRAVSDEDLQSTLRVPEYGYRPEEWIPVKGAAQAEIDRRAQEATRKLAMKTTRWSAGVTAVGTICGAIIGATATVVVFWMGWAEPNQNETGQPFGETRTRPDTGSSSGAE